MINFGKYDRQWGLGISYSRECICHKWVIVFDIGPWYIELGPELKDYDNVE